MTIEESTQNDVASSTPVVFPPATSTNSTSDVIQSVEERLDDLEQNVSLLERLGSDDSFQYEPLDYEVPAEFLLSIVIPAYNEEQTIETILRRVSAMPLPHEIIVVDDCSQDSTRDKLRALEACRDLTVIYHPENRGKGAALGTGFQRARGKVVVIQDADLEYDPRDLPKVVRPIVEDRADAVYGSRFLHDVPQDPSAFHRFGNALLTKTSNLFTRLRLTDMETCYKAFRRDVLSSIPLRQNRFGFEPEITAKLARRRARMVEVPIRYQARSYEEGKKIGLRDAFSAFYCILRYGLGD